jgi:hypothetical protein
MLIVRDVFRCKPGKSRQVAEIFKAALKHIEGTGSVLGGKVMLDLVADFWTVAIELEVKDLGAYEREMETYASREEFRKIMAGYMELVTEGRREIYRLV